MHQPPQGTSKSQKPAKKPRRLKKVSLHHSVIIVPLICCLFALRLKAKMAHYTPLKHWNCRLKTALKLYLFFMMEIKRGCQNLRKRESSDAFFNRAIWLCNRFTDFLTDSFTNFNVGLLQVRIQITHNLMCFLKTGQSVGL